MTRKDKNDRAIFRKLNSLEYEFTWEDYSQDDNINSILAIASKNGEGNIGLPDHIYINKHKKLLILIEDKSTISEHYSGYNKQEYLEGCVIKAITNSKLNKKSKVTIFDKEIPYNPSKYAVDGILWYMSFFNQKFIQNENVKNYFLDWKIIGISISGNIDELYNYKINTFLLLQNKIVEKKDITELKNEDDYINMCINLVEEELIENISTSSKK